MSLWIYKNNKEGNKELFAVSFPLPIIMLLLGLLVALIVPNIMKPHIYLKESSYVAAVGFILVLISKVSLFKKGVWNSWGSKLMSKPYRILYRCGYVLIIIGIIGCIYL